MESISLFDPGQSKERGFERNRDISPIWAVCGDGKSGRHFCGMSHLLFFLRVSWVSLAGCGAGEEEVAFAGVAGKGGGAFELGAGFEVSA